MERISLGAPIPELDSSGIIPSAPLLPRTIDSHEHQDTRS